MGGDRGSLGHTQGPVTLSNQSNVCVFRPWEEPRSTCRRATRWLGDRGTLELKPETSTAQNVLRVGAF